MIVETIDRPCFLPMQDQLKQTRLQVSEKKMAVIVIAKTY